MARIHGLQHVERFRSAAFADDDSFGPHTQRVAHQVRGRDGAFAFDIRRSRFQSHNVLLLELQFRGVLDRHDAVRVGDEARQRVQQRRFAGARTAGNDHVQARLDRAFEQHDHLGREGLVVQQVFELERVGAKAANGNRRAVQRQGRNDRVHARAVLQAGVDHRTDFVHAPADFRHDAINDLHQMIVVAERDARSSPSSPCAQRTRAWDR